MDTQAPTVLPAAVEPVALESVVREVLGVLPLLLDLV
jgi:hypothetical protein